MKHFALILWLLFSCLTSFAQVTWHDPLHDGKLVVRGQGWDNGIDGYCRLPQRAQEVVRKPLWDLACHSAGLSVRFSTDAQEIKVRYSVTGSFSMPHMPSTGVSGVDLYRIDDGALCFGSYSFRDTVNYSYSIDRVAGTGTIQEYELFLPLYNGVKFLEIGVASDCHFSFVAKDKCTPIVVYGTSIAQGGCASRPAMAWPTIVQRTLKHQVVNLGFSGNGRLEPEVISLINEIDAAAYVIDCMPNIDNRTEQEVVQLVLNAVAQIRSQHSTPILLIEHSGFSNTGTNQHRYDMYTTTNCGLRKAYEQLTAQGVEGLYYLSNEELNYSPDARVDYVHPTDLGMNSHAEAVAAALRNILK